MDDDGTDNGGVTSSVLPDLTSQEQFSEYYQPVGKCILIGSSYYSWYVVSLLRQSSPASLMD